MWPKTTTCHVGEPFSDIRPLEWFSPRLDDEPYGRPFRTCSYCGSIHPEDLLLALQNGATLDRADMKYGFPHKFYVHGIPNPQAGKQVRVGSKSGPNPDGTRYEQVLMDDAPTETIAKWYSQHLEDLDAESFALLAPLLIEKTGIEWVRDDDGRVKWRFLPKWS